MQEGGARPDDALPRAGLVTGVLLSLIACVPFLVARYPQQTDYPSHLARYLVMLDGGRDAWLARYYDFEWILAGNLGADLLMVPLGRMLGAETAAWLLGLAIPLLTGLGIVAILRALQRPLGIGPLLAFATIWSPAMGMGFANFCLSLALALLAFALWIRISAWRWRWLLFVPLGAAVWLCHVSGWGVLGVLVVGYEWHRRKDLSAFVAPWPLAFPALLQLAAGGARGSLDFGNKVFEYKALIWLQAFRDRIVWLDIATLAILVLSIAAAAWGRRIDGRLGWAALICGLLSLGIPRHLGGGDYADYRLIAVALMLGAMAVEWRARPPLLVLAAALFMVRITVTAQAWHASSRRTEAALTVLDPLPEGAKVAGTVAIRRGWPLDPMEHVPSYATLRRSALVNTHFAVPGVHMLKLRTAGPDFADPSHRVFYKPGERIDLTSFAPARQAEWLWYIGEPEPAALPPGARVVARAPGSLLARLAKPGTPR